MAPITLFFKHNIFLFFVVGALLFAISCFPGSEKTKKSAIEKKVESKTRAKANISIKKDSIKVVSGDSTFTLSANKREYESSLPLPPVPVSATIIDDIKGIGERTLNLSIDRPIDVASKNYRKLLMQEGYEETHAILAEGMFSARYRKKGTPLILSVYGYQSGKRKTRFTLVTGKEKA